MPSPENRLRILQVSTLDVAGGAEKVALSLFQSCRSLGHRSWLVVGRRRSAEPGILQMPNESCRNRWAKACHVGERRLQPLAGRVRGASRAQGLLRVAADPLRWLGEVRGHEDFGFPGTRRLLELTPERPTIVHCHNLHGAYFDLRTLPRLSGQVPVVLTLHDAWLLSGHCAHSYDCERWTTGCGHCPDLTMYQSIRQDATAYNWRRKQQIFGGSRLYVATPSQWLMEKVKQSMLAPAVMEARVIHNGVDLSVFRPASRSSIRAGLGIPQDTMMLLFTANGIRRNRYKDYHTLRTVVARVAERVDRQRVLLVALGEDSPTEQVGRAELRFIPYQKDSAVVARYYQAADIYVHAARAEVWGLTITEALACGTPVVATAVGGIPEQIQEARTGFLVPPGDAGSMAEAVVALLKDESLRTCMGRNAAQDARQRFDLKRQVDDYIAWYYEISTKWHGAGETESGRRRRGAESRGSFDGTAPRAEAGP